MTGTGGLPTLVDTRNKSGPFRLRSVTTEKKNTDYYLEVKSLSKEKKEEGMKLSFEKKFETRTPKDHTALQHKGGVEKIGQSPPTDRQGQTKVPVPVPALLTTLPVDV